MSMTQILTNLAVQDDDQTASVLAEALNSDQRIRALQGQAITWDAGALRRVANALVAHSIGLEAEVRRAAPGTRPLVPRTTDTNQD